MILGEHQTVKHADFEECPLFNTDDTVVFGLIIYWTPGIFWIFNLKPSKGNSQLFEFRGSAQLTAEGCCKKKDRMLGTGKGAKSILSKNLNHGVESSRIKN